jgi:ribose 5-phosphate isomerase B
MKGILLCGSGNGINMTANKHQGVRSALCWSAEIAKLAREHNDANILTLPARFLTDEEALQIVDVFFNTEFEGGRHQKRIEKIPCL